MVLSGSDNQSVATEGGRSVRIDMNLSVSTASIEPRLAAAAALADSLHGSSDVDDELWSQLGDLLRRGDPGALAARGPLHNHSVRLERVARGVTIAGEDRVLIRGLDVGIFEEIGVTAGGNRRHGDVIALPLRA